jgi:hypothetical protein
MTAVGTNRTNRTGLAMSVDRGNPEVAVGAVRSHFDPSETFQCGALDRTLHLDDHERPAELGRHHGRRGLAAEPWPRTIRGGIPRE